MPKLTIWSGGVKIYPVNGSDEEPSMENPESIPADTKFNTCAFRSNEVINRLVRTCCSSRDTKGYECKRIQIFPLNASNCKTCALYVARGKAT